MATLCHNHALQTSSARAQRGLIDKAACDSQYFEARAQLSLQSSPVDVAAAGTVAAEGTVADDLKSADVTAAVAAAAGVPRNPVVAEAAEGTNDQEVVADGALGVEYCAVAVGYTGEGVHSHTEDGDIQAAEALVHEEVQA